MIRRLIKFATNKTGIFETISLVLTYLNRVSLNTIRDLLEQTSLEEGFSHVNQKLVDFLRAPDEMMPDLIPTNDFDKYTSKEYKEK